MKKTALFVALATMVFFVVPAVMAQQTNTSPTAPGSAPATGGSYMGGSQTSAPQGKMEKFYGVVEGVDQTGQSFTVQKHKGNMTFYWNDQTRIMQGKKTLSPMDLKKGEHVTVAYREEGGKTIADRIDVGKMYKKSHPKSESKT